MKPQPGHTDGVVGWWRGLTLGQGLPELDQDTVPVWREAQLVAFLVQAQRVLHVRLQKVQAGAGAEAPQQQLGRVFAGRLPHSHVCALQGVDLLGEDAGRGCKTDASEKNL